MKLGFTLPELVVVLGLVAGLAGLTTVNLLRPIHQASTSAVAATLIADLRQQQLAAMLGNTQGSGSPASYGIFFNSDAYTLFRGASYQPDDPANFTVNLNSPLQISTTLTNNQIVFTPGNGEVVDFNPGSDTIMVADASSDAAQTITLTSYGTVVNIN